MKMTGEGLWHATNDNTDPERSCAGAAEPWLCDLELAPDHVGALAVQGRS